MEQDSTVTAAKTYSRLLGYVRRYWLAFVVSISGLVLHSAAEVAFVDLLGYITDTVGTMTGAATSETGLPTAGLTASFANAIFGDSLMENRWMVIPIFLVAVSILRGLGYLIGSYGLAYVANYLVHALRVDILNKYLLNKKLEVLKFAKILVSINGFKSNTLKEGDTIRLTLTNSGGNHDFVIDEIEGAKTKIIFSRNN